MALCHGLGSCTSTGVDDSLLHAPAGNVAEQVRARRELGLDTNHDRNDYATTTSPFPRLNNEDLLSIPLLVMTALNGIIHR